MRKNFGKKTWCLPMPVFIISAYDENGLANCMNAAWGGISEENEISICISADHKTTKNILLSGAFTVSMATAKYACECDYVGIVSGNTQPQKMQKVGFTTQKSQFVNAPIINELPMSIECNLINYDENSCILKGEIVNVSCDDTALDKNGNIDVDKMAPITYDPIYHNYMVLGKVVGKAFSDGKKFR